VNLIESRKRDYSPFWFSSEEADDGTFESRVDSILDRSYREGQSGPIPRKYIGPPPWPEAAVPVRSLSRMCGQCTLGAYLRGEVRRPGLLQSLRSTSRIAVNVSLTRSPSPASGKHRPGRDERPSERAVGNCCGGVICEAQAAQLSLCSSGGSQDLASIRISAALAPASEPSVSKSRMMVFVDEVAST
jgi:hypothetical protein